jgi:TonB family protein
MDHYRKSLSNALLFSIALHTAVFGSAIAFAHYGGLLRGHDLSAITVSLVGGRGMGGAGAGAGAMPARRELPREPALSEIRKEPLPEQTKGLSDVHSFAPESNGMSTAPYSPGGTTDDGGAATGSADSEARGLSDGFTTEQWRQLYIAIERAKNYPRFARERGIEGTVLVRFRVLPNGEIEKVDVIKSSGSDILDTASVRTVYRAAPMPYVNGWVEVPMSYVLK